MCWVSFGIMYSICSWISSIDRYNARYVAKKYSCSYLIGFIRSIIKSKSPCIPLYPFQRSKRNPIVNFFILPLQKAGVEFYVMQSTEDQIYYTQLEAYKANPDQAVPVLVLTHYTELEKVILMRGEVQGVSMEDARRLVYLTQLFYGDEKKFVIVEAFSKGGMFDYNDIIRAADVLE